MRILLALVAAFIWTLLSTHLVRALDIGDAGLCQRATAIAEHSSGVPDQLLDAISRVESGRYDEAQGVIRAWPWTINEEGQGHFYRSKAEAVEAARQFRARGIQSMDVGCTQINLMFHPAAFASLEAAFDPSLNTAYAAHFLSALFHQVGSWPHAAAAYHSQTPELGTDYQRKVLEAWAEPIDGPVASANRPHLKGAGLADFHRQIASLSAFRPTGTLSGALLATHPFGGSFGASAGGRINRTAAAQPLFTGRNLAAYRARPVAMLSASPRPSRY